MRMKIIAALNFIAIVGTLIVPICTESTESDESLTISVPNAPPSEDDSDYTIVYDKKDGYKKVALGDIQGDEVVPFFDVGQDVRFELFTTKNPTVPQILELNNYTTVKQSNFNWWRPTRILVHGWMSEGILTPRFTEAYFSKGKHKVNFIAVNWQKGSDVYNYMTARGRVPDVATQLAKFVDFMSKKAWLRIKSLTIVGHSLGAHVAGIAGKKITRGKVGKIVGLDPASPLFKHEKVNERLAENDASYVEVIHTCAGTLGMSKPIGQASFYPNGGTSQPGCKWDILGICAHQRAYEYYIESIIRPEFYGLRCDSFDKLKKGNCSVNGVAQMGGEPGNKKFGVFYLETNKDKVFARGKNGVVKTVLGSSGDQGRLRKWGNKLKSIFKKRWW